MNRSIYLCLLSFLLPLIGYSQHDDVNSQYMFSGLVLNPAYAGSNDAWNITALYRRQWAGFTDEGIPESQFLSVDGSLKNKRIGLGALLYNENIGVTGVTEAYLNYAYHIPLGAKARLSFGLRGGVSYYRARLTELVVFDQDDVVFQSDIEGSIIPKFGAGVYFYTRNLYAGVSAPTIAWVEPNNSPKLERHYYFTAGYAWEISDNFVIKPTGLVKYVKDQKPAYDLNLNFLLFERLWLGGGYHSQSAFIGMMDVWVTRKLRVGYAYEMPRKEIRNFSNGSHEIMLSYDFLKGDNLKIKTPRFF